MENLIILTEQLIDESILRKPYALNGRKMSEDIFEWKQLIKSMNKIYKSVFHER